jgi:Arc/MetJ-type ribon-helix-helix transcriptional regulator
MVKTLERAIAEIATLPAEAQEEIGRRMLAHVEKLRELRATLDQAAAELDAGQGRELDIDEFLIRMRRENAKT